MRPDMSPSGFRFERYVVDLARASLRRGDDEVPLRPKSFDVLCYLVENAGRVVAKDELIAAVWKNVFVTDDSLTLCVREIRQALADDGQRLIRTIPRRGYLFEPAVTRLETTAASDSPAAPAGATPVSPPPRPAAAHPDWWRWGAPIAGLLALLALVAVAAWPRGAHHLVQVAAEGPPSVAVLLFDMDLAEGSEMNHNYFSDGLTDDVIAALGRFSNLRVLSRASLSGYKGKAWEPDRLWRELKVRYVVDGSVNRTGNRLRVRARLTDAAQRTLLWSESYNEELNDVFAVQDRLARSIVGRLAVRISHIEHKRAAAKPTDSMEAYDYVLRGRDKLARITRADNLEARRLFQKAVELDSRYASALVGLGWTYQYDLVEGWTERPHEASSRAHALAHRALQLNESDPAGHRLLATVHLLKKEHGLGLAEADRAIELNPNDADGHVVRGITLVWMGRPDEAIAAFETATRFDPGQSPPRSLAHMGLAYHLVGRHEDAVRAFQSSIGRNPEFVLGHIGLAATYAELGKPLEAREAAATVRRLDPFFAASSFGTLFAVEQHRQYLVARLQKAGL